MEYLELSVPVAGSGKFIELHHIGMLEKAQPHWSKYCRLRIQLEDVRRNLSNCNDATWLFHLANNCRRQRKDFERQLQLYVDGLEKLREILEKRDEEIRSKLREVDPSLLQACHTLIGSRLFHHYEMSRIVPQTFNSDIVKRRGIIAKYAHLGSSDLCGHFNVEDLPLPEEWTKKFPAVDSWVTAYKNPVLRNRIHKLISDDKRWLRLR